MTEVRGVFSSCAKLAVNSFWTLRRSRQLPQPRLERIGHGVEILRQIAELVIGADRDAPVRLPGRKLPRRARNAAEGAASYRQTELPLPRPQPQAQRQGSIESAAIPSPLRAACP